MIPSLQWHLFYDAFEKFASMARQYHFYENDVARMEASIFEMSPYKSKEEKKQ